MKTLGAIADYVGGTLRGDPQLAIERVVHPALAQGPADLALVLSKNALPYLSTGKVQCAVVPAEAGDTAIPNQITVDRPRLVLARLMELFERRPYVAPGIHPASVIDASATIGTGVAIGPHCWVGPGSVIGDSTQLICNVSVGAEVTIGERCLVHAGVCIGDRSRIGSRVIIQPNVNIGGDGFAFVTREPGSVESVRDTGEVRSFNTEIVRINSIGHVVIEDDVEIGSGTCIDRGTLGETRIGRGSKLDNLIQVGHNVTIGENCLVVAQVGLGGSSKVGDRAVVGGQAGVPDHMQIGNDAVVHAQAGISANVPERSVLIGSPAIPKREFLEREVQIKRLPNLRRMIKELQARVAELEEKLRGV
jgi:UDP-3-O-[3-hydroxymyristoyl] glucosamine N-acyltransferase